MYIALYGLLSCIVEYNKANCSVLLIKRANVS